MLYIYDTVLQLIKKDIGDFAPERGGALLGEPGKPIVTHFIFDPTATTTTSTYSPSRLLNHMVRRAEKEDGLEYKGIIHSHPGSYDQPSGQDLKELKMGLQLNEHMPYYLAPIVTKYHFGIPHKHEVILGEMKVSFYAGYRQDNKSTSLSGLSLFSRDEVQLKKMEIDIIPKGKFKKDLEELASSIIGLKKPEVYMVENDGIPMLAGSIEVEGVFDLFILTETTYPSKELTILVTYANGNQEQIKLELKNRESHAHQLEEMLTSLIKKPTTTSCIANLEEPKINRTQPKNSPLDQHPLEPQNKPKDPKRNLNFQKAVHSYSKNSFSISNTLYPNKEK